MNCAIMQPSYIPWRGFFHLVHRSDVFVHFDETQYTRRSWRNRNRIKGPESVRWITIPVHSKGFQTKRIPIRDIRVNWSTRWNVSHREILHQTYRAAPFYRRYSAVLDQWYAREPEFLADFTIDLIQSLAAELGVRKVAFVRSSELDAGGEKTERVVSIMRQVGADHLVNGPTARAYTDHELLREAGLSWEYMDYRYPEYPQLHRPFDAHVSVLDLLLMVGPEAPRYIWG